ncbi:MAG: DUF1223 domain-containing protein [Paracoccus sp. (in: a-proteobacteria)]|uniref:DUF1223 domain-containing protein n=1 Tax=Paracoccus sp. TaxID=267 RepID=UPI0026DF6520|nr:DUF1223 domain-containing protein [Paracoccus sp. (in: a-proteobacteria)]MDO5630777.1 DUF1223 domain-containing protein [Paracoccus sp. (in: a-proteobacteria)]
MTGHRQARGQTWRGTMAAALLAGVLALIPGVMRAETVSAADSARIEPSDALGRAIEEVLSGAINLPEPVHPQPAVPVIGASDPPPVIGAGDPSGQNALFAGGGAVPAAGMLPLSRLPVVVELFTSQGCSNCPPADAMMAELVRQPDVLPLTFNVDYWNYLGWADSFARPQFTQRQKNYAAAAGERSVYTPQVIVDGQDTLLTLRPADLMALVDMHRASPAMLTVVPQRDGARLLLEFQPLSDLSGPFAVQLVGYVPERQVTITAGENHGRTITYRNVVVSLHKLADWDGRQPLRLSVSPGREAQPDLPRDTRNAVLVQQVLPQGLPGPIVAAMRLE